ncbi:MAG: hypothetical protein ACRDWS_00275 [Acidimicrobiia bacterium]
MFHIYADELIRQLEEERRHKALREAWWRQTPPEPETTTRAQAEEAEVIELFFGPQCEAEEPIGA